MTITRTLPNVGDLVRTAAGYYLVEGFAAPDELDAAGYVLARRAERPMTHTRPVHLGDILEVVERPSSGSAR